MARKGFQEGGACAPPFFFSATPVATPALHATALATAREPMF